MPVSPQEFSLWARMTGNKYPNSVEEKVRLAPEVHNFSQNVGKQGALGVEQEPEPEQQSNLGSNLAKGALIAGGIAAGVAAARNPGVQEAVKTASGKASDFISKITTPREVNVDTAEAVRDVTNSAPGDVYSQAIVPVSQRVAGLLQEVDEPYVHPSRITGMPGGDYRGRRTTYTPEQQEAFRLTKQEADERAILGNEGVIPPGMLTKEQQAYLKLNELGGETLQAGRQRSAERDLEGQQRAEINRARDYAQDQRMQADAYWNSPEGQAEILEIQADAAYMNSDLGKANYEKEAELDSRGISYDHRPQIEAWKDAWKKEQTGNQSLSNKADAVISALGALDPDFGHTQYAPSEAVEAANADLSQNPVNTALSSPSTPGNNVPTIKGTYDPGTLTGQQQIQMSADNAVDQVETSSAMEQVRAKKAQLAQSTGIRGTRADRFIEKYFPSMQQAAAAEIEADLAAHTAINPEDASTVARAYYDPDKGGVLREGSSDNDEGMTIVKRNPFRERSLPNYGPEAQVTKPATTSSIRGGGRRLDSEEAMQRIRDTAPSPEVGGLRGEAPSEIGPDVQTRYSPRGVKPIITPATQRIDREGKRQANPAGIGVYGRETGFVPGAMSSQTGDYSSEAKGARYSREEGMYDPGVGKGRKPSEPLFEDREIKNPYVGLSDEGLQKHIERTTPGSPSAKALQGEVARRSGVGIPISQKMREIHTTGNPSTRSERAQAFLDELRRNQ